MTTPSPRRRSRLPRPRRAPRRRGTLSRLLPGVYVALAAGGIAACGDPTASGDYSAVELDFSSEVLGRPVRADSVEIVFGHGRIEVEGLFGVPETGHTLTGRFIVHPPEAGLGVELRVSNRESVTGAPIKIMHRYRATLRNVPSGTHRFAIVHSHKGRASTAFRGEILVP